MNKLSLMTFPMDREIRKNKLSVQNLFEIAKSANLDYGDIMQVNHPDEYISAISQTDVKINCYVESISFFLNGCLSRITSAIEKAKKFQANMLMIVPYYPIVDIRKANRMGKEKVLALYVETFRKAIELGKKENVKICFETTPKKEICLSNNIDISYVLDRVEGLGYVFDSANMLPSGEEPLKAFEILKDKITYVHLKDVRLSKGSNFMHLKEETADGRIMEVCLPGEGVVPVQQIFESLIDSGYKGDFALEYCRPSNDLLGKETHIEQAKKFVNYYESVRK